MESWWCTLSALVAFSLILQLDALYIYPVGKKHLYNQLYKYLLIYDQLTKNLLICFCFFLPEDKAGVCPYENWNPLWEACPDKCHNDYDCPHHEKCCRKGCGRVCVDTNHG
uniref:WAP domain-containing protein n=1 Tax=Gouania willdenowi TaxID=441366 RepID=A0A8C5DAH6_GOUWI